MINEQAVSKFCLRQPVQRGQKSPYRTFLTTLSAEHFESFQNARRKAFIKAFNSGLSNLRRVLPPQAPPLLCYLTSIHSFLTVSKVGVSGKTEYTNFS